MFAPEFDNCIGFLKSNPEWIDIQTLQRLEKLYALMQRIKVQGDDELRSVWIEVPRGGIRKYGSYSMYKREGMVSTRDEFRQMWLNYYPGKTKWYKFSTAKYRDDHYFYVNSDLIFTLNGKNIQIEGKNDGNHEIHEFLDELSTHVTLEIENLRKDPAGWNSYVHKNLSFNLRVGKIKREALWQIFNKEVVRFDEQVGKRRIVKLKKYIAASDSPGYNRILDRVTADDFFRFCEIAYDSNAYFKGTRKKMTSREKYTAMADGRDGGLRQITGYTAESFRDWYHGGDWRIGHPWEICRGGNSTHISLSVHPEGSVWRMSLSGSSAARVVETVKIAIALSDRGIPFELIQKEEVLRMVTGEDYVGIVPDYIFPRYCHRFFSQEDRIIDFMNLYREDEEKIIPAASWYPLDPVETENGGNRDM